jgi:hypothetical protein
MMKTLKARRAGVLAIGIALAGFFAVCAFASAQYPSENRDRRRAMIQQNYDRMRQYARELDDLAREANRQAQAQQFGYRGFRRDSNFLRDIDHFARRASEFRARMDTYQTAPWAVDDEINHLLRDARNVETRIRRARFVDRRTVANWNRTVSLLNQMASEYQAGTGGRWRGRGDGRYGNPNSPPPPGTYREPNANEPPPPPDYREGQGDRRQGQGSRRGQGDLRQLAAELDARAARASQLYGGNSGYSPELSHFSTQARNFRNLVEQNRISDSELRSQVNHLLDDAQSAQQELSSRSASREVADEWNAIVQILTRMRDSI